MYTKLDIVKCHKTLFDIAHLWCLSLFVWCNSFIVLARYLYTTISIFLKIKNDVGVILKKKKKQCHVTPLPSQNGYLSITATFLCPLARLPLWNDLTVQCFPASFWHCLHNYILTCSFGTVYMFIALVCRPEFRLLTV